MPTTGTRTGAETSAKTSAAAHEFFGTNLVAMVTPMHPDGRIDDAGRARLVQHLLAGGCDGIVVAGTTGEAPTLTGPETVELIEGVAGLVRGRARVIAGVGTNDTAADLVQARAAARAGADALLLVCPYYSKPTQAGVVAHCRAVADATDLPVMLYDVPHRAGIAMETSTLQTLAGHPNIRAVKDAKGDLFQAARVMATTRLAYYCGTDDLNLPYLAIGAVGLVSVIGNVVPALNADLVQAVRQGDLVAARAIHEHALPLVEAISHASQGAVLAKAALTRSGILAGATVRPPLVEPEAADLDRLTRVLQEFLLPQVRNLPHPAA